MSYGDVVYLNMRNMVSLALKQHYAGDMQRSLNHILVRTSFLMALRIKFPRHHNSANPTKIPIRRRRLPTGYSKKESPAA